MQASSALSRQMLAASFGTSGTAHAGHLIDQFLTDATLRDAVQNADFDVTKFLFSMLHLSGGITLLAPDKTIDYRKTPNYAKYAFTFWAFPRTQWLATLRAYLDFADQHFQTTGFRCNMPLRRLSYSSGHEFDSVLHLRSGDFLHRPHPRPNRRKRVE